MAQSVLTQNYFPLAGRGDADTRGRGWWGRGVGQRLEDQPTSPLPSWEQGLAAASDC